MSELLSADFPAQPIWLKDGGEDNEYVDFLPGIRLMSGRDYILRIACDTDYNVFIGEKLAGFGQYPGYPDELIYDEIPLSPEKNGDELRICVWHSGIDSFIHVRHKAYVAFCIFESGSCIYSSGVRTPSVLSSRYVQHGRRLITPQQGPGFDMDGTSATGRARYSGLADIGPVKIRKRPVAKLVFGSPVAGKIVRFGRFRFTADASDSAEAMGEAELDVTAEKSDGSYYLFDFGSETVGFPEIRFCVSESGTAHIGWGEHIRDGMCRVGVGGRRFVFSYSFTAGDNRIMPSFRRIGCRYLQLFIPGRPGSVSAVMHPTDYPVSEKNNTYTGIRAEIYRAAVRTLRCCMHEHYEDCPWREQALYSLDSRNQMLAGYTAFENGNIEMARASLDLISKGIRPDGLLSICYPGGRDRPIPFYTLAFFIQMNEYIRFSGDVSFLNGKIAILESLMSTVLKRQRKEGFYRGLVPGWPVGEARYWNFYEWSEGLDGSVSHPEPEVDGGSEVFDAPFNAALVIALECYSEMLRRSGRDREAEERTRQAKTVKEAVDRVFKGENGLYRNYAGAVYDRTAVAGGRNVSVLTQALCVLAGIKATEKMLSVIAGNGGCGSVPATLSMACFRYDALLKTDREKYARTILREIDRDCEYMLNHGATTFWETLNGESDFGGAGSLCHGWSAMAVHYYATLLN